MEIVKVPFGKFNGQPVTKFVLVNDHGVQAGILDFAGLLQSFKVPTKDGGLADMVLTSENLDEFTGNGFCTNRLIGRVAGRIADGKFQIDGQEYQVEQNEGKNTLHGGKNGFYNHIWHVDGTKLTDDTVSVTLSLTLTEEMDTFPGKMHVVATYTLDNDDNLSLQFSATSDANTLFNPTQAEAVTMAAIRVFGNDTVVTMASSQGNFEMNVYKPVLIDAFLESADLLAGTITGFADRCVAGMTVNEKRMAELVDNSLMTVTALSPHIGYHDSAKIAQAADKAGSTLKEAALKSGKVTEEQYDEWMDMLKMTNVDRED